MNDHALFDGVCACIRQTLERDLPDIRETDRLIRDLGADSLDFLDLIFRLEKAFNVRVNPRDLERRTQERLGDAPMLVDGRYTAAAVAEFRKAMPEVPPEEPVIQPEASEPPAPAAAEAEEAWDEERALAEAMREEMESIARERDH